MILAWACPFNINDIDEVMLTFKGLNLLIK